MSDIHSLSELLAAAIERVAPSVVRIDLRCGATTGLVARADGLVVTTHHALDRDEAEVTLHDGRSARGTVRGRDPGTDLALLQLDVKDLAVPAWSDGASLKVGHLVTPVGRPGRGARATLGMISALGDGFRTMAGGAIDRHIEVDGSLPRGFSGGPLVDTRGEVIGLNTAGLLRGGTTIPASTVRRVVDALAAHGRIAQGFLGVGAHPVRLPAATAETAKQSLGLLLTAVEPDSPAAKGGLLLGDILLTVDGQPTERPGDLIALLAGKANVSVSVSLVRGGEARTIDVVTGERR